MSQENQMSKQEVKALTDMYESQIVMYRAMNSPAAEENIRGLKSVVEQPVTDFKKALINPLLEGMYSVGTPLMNEVTKIIEQLSGTVGSALRPTMEALAFAIGLLAPIIEDVTDFLERGITDLFTIDINKDPANFLPDAFGGAAAGAASAAAATYLFNLIPGVGTIGYGASIVIGGILGFIFGGFF